MRYTAGVLGVVIGCLSLSAGSIVASAVSLPPPGQVTQVGSAPNKWANLHPGGDFQEAQTTMWADPANHLLFQYNAAHYYQCPGLVTMDSDTYAVKTTLPGCGPPTQFGIGPVNPSGNSVGVAHAEDSADHLMFAADNSGGALNSANGGTAEIYVFDEATLKLRGTWALPQPPDPAAVPFTQVSGISYYPALDEVLTLDGNLNHPGEGAAITAFSVSQGLAQHRAVPLWSAMLRQCMQPLLPQFAQAAPYHATHEAAIYVPCTLEATQPPTGAGTNQSVVKSDGVVKVPMLTSGCAASGCGGCQVAASHECPDAANAKVAVAPGLSDDTVFDPVSDRLFLPSTSSGEVEVLVYDGNLNLFMGSVVAGSYSQGSNNYTALGFDPASGRMYLVNGDGMWLMDARRTPVALFGKYPTLARPEGLANIFPALPPDVLYPFTRVLVNGDVDVSASTQTVRMPNYVVFADTSSGLTDPSQENIDSNTLKGAPPPGSLLQETFHGVARGYGFHSDLVGGPNGLGNVVNTVNALGAGLGVPNVTLPLGSGNRDILGGTVRGLALRGDGADATATALGAVDDSTDFQAQQCTDIQQVHGCTQQPQCSAVPSGVPCPGSVPLPTDQPTGQQPPFHVATCSQPGPTSPTDTEDGGYYTQWSKQTGDWQPAQSQLPGMDASRAHANVACTAAPQAVAWLNGTSVDEAPGPAITIAGSSTASSARHSGDGKGVVSTVTAVARGIDINLGPAACGVGAGCSLHIGEVAQQATTSAAGTANTAGATDLVSISEVVVDGKSVCGTTCDPTQVAQAIDDAFPTAIHVAFPQADDRYMRACSAEADGTRKCAGSPGGYIAAVQANLPEQYGDQAFNGMTSEVSSFLPAMRLVLYFTNDGNPSRSREVLDLAGVQAESANGFSALAPAGNFPDIPELQEFQQATLLPSPTDLNPLSFPAGPNPAAPQGGILGALERIFAGLTWLLRSPAAALQMTAFLAFLVAPAVLAIRRGAATAGAT